MSWFRETMLKAEAKAEQFENWVKDSASSGADRTKQAAGDTVDLTNEFVDNFEESTEAQLDRIPGYSGYQDKERRRDSDRVLRVRVADQIDANALRVEAIQRTAANARDVETVNALEPVVQGLRNLANVVRTQSYGYAGLFANQSVDAAALDQLRLFDEGLLVKSAALTSAVDSLEAGSSADASAITKQIADLKASLKLRAEVIDDGRPAKSAKPTQASTAGAKAFETEDGKSQSPVSIPDVGLGDAMSVLGDDHIVEAVIDVESGDVTHRFIRLDNSPQMWLWLSNDPAQTPQKLLGSDVPDGVTWRAIEGRARIVVPGERSRSGPAVIRTGETPEGANVVQLDIDGAVQSFKATDTHMDDIETYRAK